MLTPFHRIVCSAETVRTAFSSSPLLQAWWSLVLYCHGKQSIFNGSESERIRIIACGFRFYAWLYGSLGLLLVIAGIALQFAGQPLYTSVSIAFNGILLLTFVQFGYRASQDFEIQKPGSPLSLLLFIVFLMLFLTGFLCVASVVVNGMGIISPLGNLLITSILLFVGVGSYFIELIFLTDFFSFSKSSC